MSDEQKNKTVMCGCRTNIIKDMAEYKGFPEASVVYARMLVDINKTPDCYTYCCPDAYNKWPVGECCENDDDDNCGVVVCFRHMRLHTYHLRVGMADKKRWDPDSSATENDKVKIAIEVEYIPKLFSPIFYLDPDGEHTHGVILFEGKYICSYAEAVETYKRMCAAHGEKYSKPMLDVANIFREGRKLKLFKRYMNVSHYNLSAISQ